MPFRPHPMKTPRRKRLRQVQRQSLSLRKVAFAVSLAAIAGSALFILNNLGPSEEASASPGKDGSKTITSVNTIVNEYTYLTNDVSAGATQIKCNSNTLNANSRFSGNLAAGDLLLIIQMQGATITTSDNSSYGNVSSYNNCGLHEFAKVSSIGSSGRINLSDALKNSYTSARKVQVVRVPRYTTLTINSGKSITCPDWDGSTGGIVAVEAAQEVIINGSISVTGKGFRGGALEQGSNLPGNASTRRSSSGNDGGEKGESIAGLASGLSGGQYCRNAPANGGGGGNAHNCAGGGGANAGTPASWTGNGNPDNSNSNWTTAWNLESTGFASTTSSGGGRGGYSYSANDGNELTRAPGHSDWGGDNRLNGGGYGGRPLDYSGGRVFFGGGGGAGDSNNSTGTAGGDGGGIVFILAKNNVSGSGAIYANGDDVSTQSGNDGSGGGGGGGVVIIFNQSGSTSGISVQAKGGYGGSQNLAWAEAEGAGGGGGGGYVAITNLPAISINVDGGANGTSNSPSVTNFTPNGATKGGAGATASLSGSYNPYSASNNPLPVTLTYFLVKPDGESALTEWETASEKNNDYFLLERSQDNINFEVIGRVTGHGSTALPNIYQYKDDAPLIGISYYRLKQVDFDGQTEIFKVIPYEHNSSISELKIVECSPNPFTSSIRLITDVPAPGIINTQILTLGGAKVWEKTDDVQEGRQIMNFYPEINSPGIYLLRITDADGHATVMKIMKK